jgi:serine/threonine-protein kinase
VAIKALRAEHRSVAPLVARFRREAAAATRVRHPNVLAVLEPIEEMSAVGAPSRGGRAAHEGLLCFATELLVGLDLADTLEHSRALGSPRAVRIAVEAADGLAAAHAVGVVHRDVKPENIFLVHAADGREAVKLLDFGFAFLPGDETPGASIVGTPEYMAPEQARGAPAEPAADVYSLGIVLYEMLAGRPPFVGSYPDVARAHAEHPVPAVRSFNPGAIVSRDLEAAIARALAKDVRRRFASMGDLRRVLLATPEARGVLRHTQPRRLA